MNIHALLQTCTESGASDLHLSAGEPARLRMNGDLNMVSDVSWTDDDIRAALTVLMTSVQLEMLKQTLACDFAYQAANSSRFRVNVFHQHRGLAAVFRVVLGSVPTLDELHAPLILTELAKSKRGLVLVTGPTGSGKSTTIAAMIDLLNRTTAKHVLTIEDPIEFVHTPRQCLINQREVGIHALSFADALRSGMREDPDVILVGELRDLDTMRLAMTAAETGHLVFATLHTTSAAKTMDRIIDVFPAQEKDMIRNMLSESLTAVISQVLCKRKDVGRIAAYEILVATPAIRNLIREGKVAQMYSLMQTGIASGMQTLDQSLMALSRQGLIDVESAKEMAKFPESIHLAIAG